MKKKRTRRKPEQVEPDDESLPHINGVGSVWGDMHGKTKTAQIGFVRDKAKAKVKANDNKAGRRRNDV